MKHFKSRFLIPAYQSITLGPSSILSLSPTYKYFLIKAIRPVSWSMTADGHFCMWRVLLLLPSLATLPIWNEEATQLIVSLEVITTFSSLNALIFDSSPPPPITH